MRNDAAPWAALLLLLLAALVGCTTPDSSTNSSSASSVWEPPPGPAEAPASGNTTLQITFGSLSGGGAGSPFALSAVQEPFSGQLAATNVLTGETQVLAWAATLDPETFQLTSSITLALSPAAYHFSLLLERDGQQYAGQALAEPIEEGQNDVPIVLRPLIGDAVADVTQLAELGEFKLHFDPEQLARFAYPQAGIAIDGGAEQVFTVNPATGLTGAWVNLSSGPRQVQLRVYNAAFEEGRSLAAQESVTIVPGADLPMNVAALTGEVSLSITNPGADGTVRVTVPSDVVEEAGGLAELEARLSLAGAGNPLQTQSVALAALGDHYEGTAVFGGVQPGDVALFLEFIDVAAEPDESLGACTVTTFVSAQPHGLLCDLVLRRRAISGGELLGSVAVNVLDDSLAPVAGAVIWANEIPLGLTGTAGTPGFFTTLLLPGSYALRAADGMRYGETGVTVTPLGIANALIALDTPVVNHDPVALDDTAQMTVDAPIVIDVLANDSDSDLGDALSLFEVGTPSSGSAVITGSTITYTRAPGFNGGDAFTYTVVDGFGGSATATVLVTVAVDINVGPGSVIGPGTVVEPGATVGRDVTIGSNGVIGAGSDIRRGATIGDDAVIGDGVVVAQDAVIGDGFRAGDGAAVRRGASVGDDVMLGAGAVIGNLATVGDGTVIGDGSTVARDANVGTGVVIGDGSTIGRDAVIGIATVVGDNVTIATDVQIGDSVSIGDGTTIRQGTSIGAGTVIGSNVLIRQNVTIGTNCTITSGVVIAANTIVPDGATFP